MGVATAIIAGAAIGAVGSSMAAKSAANSQASSDAANANNVANTNATNYAMFRQSRGAVDPSTGYASSVLPLYFQNQEANLAADANKQYASILSQSGSLADSLRTQIGLADPSFQSSLAALNGRYNGENLKQQIAYAQPVFGARTDQANAAVSGIQTGLQDTVGQLNASRAAQGYFGGSTFDRSRLAAATIGTQQAAANQVAGAKLANATDLRGLQTTDLANRQDLTPLTQGYQNYASLQAAPLQAQTQGYAAAMQPYSFFRIGNQAYQNQNLPAISPTISNGQIAGQIAGQLGGAASNYYLNQQLLNSYAQPQASNFASSGIPNYANYNGFSSGLNGNSYTAPSGSYQYPAFNSSLYQ